MATKVNKDCKKCLRETPHWDNRENKRNPKAPDWKCTVCGEGIWLPKQKVYSGQKPAYQPYKAPVTATEMGYKPKNGKDDCTISALAIIKSLIESKFYNYDDPQEETIEKIWEHLVLLRERFRKYE